MNVKLSSLNPGDKAVVVRINGKGAIARRIADMGLIPGTEIKVVRKAPLGDPIEFEVRGYYLSLRKNEADIVLVKVKEYDSL
ncbi:MAG: ferrous iron transport protein A [Thermoproteales archaeon]|nr:ferrous iron transport protein A [Thermoproteales archaeon]